MTKFSPSHMAQMLQSNSPPNDDWIFDNIDYIQGNANDWSRLCLGILTRPPSHVTSKLIYLAVPHITSKDALHFMRLYSMGSFMSDCTSLAEALDNNVFYSLYTAAIYDRPPLFSCIIADDNNIFISDGENACWAKNGKELFGASEESLDNEDKLLIHIFHALDPSWIYFIRKCWTDVDKRIKRLEPLFCSFLLPYNITISIEDDNMVTTHHYGSITEYKEKCIYTLMGLDINEVSAEAAVSGEIQRRLNAAKMLTLRATLLQYIDITGVGISLVVAYSGISPLSFMEKLVDQCATLLTVDESLLISLLTKAKLFLVPNDLSRLESSAKKAILSSGTKWNNSTSTSGHKRKRYGGYTIK